MLWACPTRFWEMVKMLEPGNWNFVVFQTQNRFQAVPCVSPIFRWSFPMIYSVLRSKETVLVVSMLTLWKLQLKWSVVCVGVRILSALHMLKSCHPSAWPYLEVFCPRDQLVTFDTIPPMHVRFEQEKFVMDQWWLSDDPRSYQGSTVPTVWLK